MEHIPNEVELLYNQCNRYSVTPDFTSLCSLIDICLGNFTCSFILLDALDECNSLELEKFLRSLKQLRDRNIKLLCTSRPHITDIDNWVEMTSSLEIFAHDDDIRNYLSHRMDKEWKFSDRLQRQVMEQLLINAQGKSHRIFYDH
jgi:hypothetical protein